MPALRPYCLSVHNWLERCPSPRIRQTSRFALANMDDVVKRGAAGDVAKRDGLNRRTGKRGSRSQALAPFLGPFFLETWRSRPAGFLRSLSVDASQPIDGDEH